MTATRRRALGVLARRGEPAVMREVAADPDAAPRTLIWLARRGDEQVVREICRNPGAPPRLLYALARGRVAALADNPRTATLLRVPTAPHVSRRLLSELLALPRPPGDLLGEAATHRYPGIRRAAATSPHLSPETCEALARDPDRDVRAQVAGRPGLPAALARLLADDPEFVVRQALAGNADASTEALAALAGDAFWVIRRHVALHPNLPWALREPLTIDPQEEVRTAAARRLVDAPAAALERIAGDPSDRVRSLVAHCPRTPPALLVTLARDPSLAVRCVVARHPATPPLVVEALAADAVLAVRRAVLERAEIDPRIILRLADDDDELMRTDVAFARNPATPTWLVERLSDDASDCVRLYAVFSGRLSAATLRRLAGDPSQYVRDAVRRARPPDAE